MARTRTFAELQAEVRQRADVENDPHITDAEVQRFVNQSCAALHALCVDMNEAYFMTSHTWLTTAGVATIEVSSITTIVDGVPVVTSTNFYKLLHIEANINGWVRSLERWTPEKRTFYKNASTWGVQSLPISYRLSRIQLDGTVLIYFAPVPDAAYSVTVDYVPGFADMTGPTDKYDGADGWEEWVVLDAAIKCLVKGEESIVDLSRERDAVFKRIESQMSTPDLDHPSVVRDTENAARTWDWMQVRR